MLQPAPLPIELTPSQVRPIVYRQLTKKHGLNIKSSGLETLTKFIGTYFGVDWRSSKCERVLDEIAKVWKSQDRGLFVESDSVLEVIKAVIDGTEQQAGGPTSSDNKSQSPPEIEVKLVKKTKAINWRDYVHIVNVIRQPRFWYDYATKRFEVRRVEGQLVRGEILGRAADLTKLFRTRYYIIYDRIMRNERFQVAGFRPSTFTNNKDGPRIDRNITLIKNMLGRDTEAFLLMGSISYGANGNLWLQDYTGKIELDVSQTNTFDEAYFCPGMFVLCDGIYQNETFYMNAVVQPPGERRTATKQFYGNLDLLGVHTRKPVSAGSSMSSSEGRRPVENIDREYENQLVKLERELENNRILFLGGDIFLDNIYVVDALRKLFKFLMAEVENEEKEAPIAIVFPGSFVSYPFTPSGMSSQYKEYFDQLAILLEEYFGKESCLRKTKLVFIPGQNDPWMAAFAGGATPVWPLNPISKLFTSRVTRACPSAVFSSNPTRIAYLSQEIVIVREDYGSKFRRNEIDLRGGDADKERENEEQSMEIDGPGEEIVIESDQDTDIDEEEAAVRRDLSRMRVENQKITKPTASRAFPPDVAEARKVIKTVLSQGHLAPLVLDLHPVAWTQDYTLQMPILPNVLCLTDTSTPQFAMSYEGCHSVNPGSFLQQGKMNWMEYYPTHGRSEIRFLFC